MSRRSHLPSNSADRAKSGIKSPDKGHLDRRGSRRRRGRFLESSADSRSRVRESVRRCFGIQNSNLYLHLISRRRAGEYYNAKNIFTMATRHKTSAWLLGQTPVRFWRSFVLDNKIHFGMGRSRQREIQPRTGFRHRVEDGEEQDFLRIMATGSAPPSPEAANAPRPKNKNERARLFGSSSTPRTISLLKQT